MLRIAPYHWLTCFHDNCFWFPFIGKPAPEKHTKCNRLWGIFIDRMQLFLLLWQMSPLIFKCWYEAVVGKLNSVQGRGPLALKYSLHQKKVYTWKGRVLKIQGAQINSRRCAILPMELPKTGSPSFYNSKRWGSVKGFREAGAKGPKGSGAGSMG